MPRRQQHHVTRAIQPAGRLWYYAHPDWEGSWRSAFKGRATGTWRIRGPIFTVALLIRFTVNALLGTLNGMGVALY